MKASYHVVISAGLAVGVQAAFHSWPATAACFFSGVLIDLDHYIEYYLLKGKMPANYQELVNFCLYGKENKIILIFHSFELLFIFWLLIYLLHLPVVFVGMAIGLTVHLLCDQVGNPIKPFFYFLAYRFAKNFDKDKMLSPAYFKRNQQGIG